MVYDPAAMEEIKRCYQLDCRFAESYESLPSQTGAVAITTAWPMFTDVRERTNKPIVDCRYMLETSR